MSYQAILQNLEKKLEQKKALLNINEDNDIFARFRGIPFICECDQVEPSGTNCCFNHAVGLPLGRNSQQCPIYSWQRENLIEPLITEKYLWIKKAAGIGCSEIVLRLIAFNCLKDDSWKNGNVCIVTAPNERLARRLVDERLKPLFYNLGATFDTERKVLILNGCHIETYAANNIDGMRSLINTKFIFLDEADFWIGNNVQEDAVKVAERYIGKSDVHIVMASTPGRPDGLFSQIEADQNSIYTKLYLHYSLGMGTIYDPIIMQKAMQSISFDQEYGLKYGGSVGSIFNPLDIKHISTDPYDLSDKICQSHIVTKWMGIDAGWGGSSDFGIVIADWRDNKLNVVYENALKSPLMEDVRKLIHELIQKYHICRVYSDGSSVVLNNQLAKDYSETINWHLLDEKTRTAILRGTSCRSPLINPVNFRTHGKYMLERLHQVVSTHQIRINADRFPKCVTALKTAVNKQGELWSLDKLNTSEDDVIDALRLIMNALAPGGYSN